MTWNRTLQRIALDASQISPTRVIITIVAAPFYAVGVVLGWIWMLSTLAWSAVAVGIDTGRRARPVEDDDDGPG